MGAFDMLSAKKVILFTGVTCLFLIAVLTSAAHLAAAYDVNPIVKASVPSAGFLQIANFLFWFVLFLVPSWGEEENWG